MSAASRLLLFLASSFGVGFLPGPKGTYGSIVGVVWYFLLRQTASAAAYLAWTFAGIAAGVWLAGKAEKILALKDAPEITIDEAACFPLAMLGSDLVLAHLAREGGSWTAQPSFYWGNLAVVFVLFRVLDIWKPAALRRAQQCPGGWGVMADDLLAAVCTALLSGFLLLVWFWFKSVSV